MEAIQIQDFDTEKYLYKYINPKIRDKETDIQRIIERHNKDRQSIESDNTLSEIQKDKLLKDLKVEYDACVVELNNTKYWIPPTEKQQEMMLRAINIEIESQRERLSSSLESSPLPEKTILENRLSIMLTQEAKERFSSIHSDVIAGRVVQDFMLVASYIGFIRFAQSLDSKLKQETPPVTTNKAKLTHPQKIILLKELGFFDLEKLIDMDSRQRDKIISMLIGEDETNTRKYINGLTAKGRAGTYNPYKNLINETVVNKLLNATP